MKGKVVAAVLGAAAVAVAGAAGLGLGGRGTPVPAAGRTGPAATAAVTRQTLVESVSLPGDLTYGAATPLASTASGTVTWLPDPGTVVRRGDALLRADELPVVLLYGPLPMYRPLTEKLTGTDVAQFERNLAALGYGGFTVDDSFSAATTAAVKRWQKDLGRPETGTVDKDQVVYAPRAVRIAQRLVRVGAAATGDVVSYTGNTRSVTVSVDAGETAWATKGKAVTVTLPNGKTVGGKVAGVSDEAATPEGGDTAPKAKVTVTFASQKALGTLERGSVSVKYTARERKNVLTVPVPALLALAEGGYGLEVVAGGASRIVPVQAGLFIGGRVEVSGAGLTEGLTVGVPGE